ncbi:B-cell receptor CD22-like [Leptodactylus fuscus]|uniref:B-cell receptor CD22-like n=1 Tax=Leptodactylus fuscus TaxID=238119 RepID=UPI003F4EA289
MREISALLFFILFQVCDGQPRKFNIPNKIEALLGSCVEIPCYTMEPPDGVNNRKVVWHVKPAPLGKRIIYSTDESQISPDYKNRAELVRPTINNCTLRIHTVKRKDVRTYYPEEEKRSFFVSVSDNVQLEVADRPSEPILSVPREIPVGESITITCMANYTCASSPPTFSWNVVGPYVTERSDLGNGTWAATSKLTYAPSEAENGSIIQCTVTYFGGQTISTTDRINIKGLDQKSNPYIGAIIGVICVILLLPLVFIIWRKRDSCDWRKKSEVSYTSVSDNFR